MIYKKYKYLFFSIFKIQIIMSIDFHFKVKTELIFTRTIRPVFQVELINFPQKYLNSLHQSNQIYTMEIIKKNKQVVYTIQSSNIYSFQANFSIHKKLKRMTLYYRIKQFTIDQKIFNPITDNKLKIIVGDESWLNVNINITQNGNPVNQLYTNNDYDVQIKGDYSNLFNPNSVVLNLQGDNGTTMQYTDYTSNNTQDTLNCVNKIRFTKNDNYAISGYFNCQLFIVEKLCDRTVHFNFGTTKLHVVTTDIIDISFPCEVTPNTLSTGTSRYNFYSTVSDASKIPKNLVHYLNEVTSNMNIEYQDGTILARLTGIFNNMWYTLYIDKSMIGTVFNYKPQPSIVFTDNNQKYRFTPYSTSTCKVE